MAERARVAVLISGRGSNMAALIYAARADDCPYEVALVTGDKPERPGSILPRPKACRSRDSTPKPRAPPSGTTSSTGSGAGDIDLIALAGFMRIIPDGFLARWDGRIVNIHPSLLPKYKGLGTHEACLAAGDDVSGRYGPPGHARARFGEILGQVEVAVLPATRRRRWPSGC